MDEVKLTVAQVAKQIGETVHVLRNWISDFRQYIPLEKSESGYNLFTQDSINVIKRIQMMARNQKLTTRQIEAILSGAERPIITDDDDRAAVAGELVEIKEMLQRQTEFNAALLKRLDEQQVYIEQRIGKRDEQLLLALREMREQKKIETARRVSWWKPWLKA